MTPLPFSLQSDSDWFRHRESSADAPSDLTIPESSICRRQSGSNGSSPFSTLRSVASSTGRSSNVNSPTIRYQATRYPNGEPLPSWLHFHSAHCTFFGIPYHLDRGTFWIEVKAIQRSGNQHQVSCLFLLEVM